MTLRYALEGQIGNAGATNSNFRLEPTYAYDVDPGLGSTSMPGFAEQAAIYRFYRVLGSRITVHASNNEVFPQSLCICPANADPGSNTANFQNYFSSINSVKGTMGPITGNSKLTLTNSFTVADFGGAPFIIPNDSYSGATAGTAPTNNIWWFIGQKSAAVQSAFVFTAIDLEVDVEFYEFQSPAA